MDQTAELIAAAEAARDHAYAPYSRYRVGAAVRTESGRIFTGANVENASYGLTICAERVAIFQAVTAGERELTAIAVSTSDGASMCGACRQVLREFGGDIVVWLTGTDGSRRQTTIAALLPGAFDGDELRRD